ncbi:MAG: hypothetical protein ACM3S1_02260 [Hyphomicrobiales bacterium]
MDGWSPAFILALCVGGALLLALVLALSLSRDESELDSRGRRRV